MSRATAPSVNSRATAAAADLVPAAGNASSPAAPLELLQLLDEWMQAASFGTDHPWRLSIAATLRDHDSADDAEPAVAGQIFGDLASRALELRDILSCVLGGNGDLAGGALSVACHIGWLADSAAGAYGAPVCIGDAEEWFLSPVTASSLKAARSQGDAA